MKLEVDLFCPHGQTHGRVSRPCVTHGLVHGRVVRPCVPCTLNLKNKMLRIEHTGRDTGVCLSRVGDTSLNTVVCLGRVKPAPNSN